MSGGSGGFWTGRTVLVTGASGFLGRHVCQALGVAGATVIGTTRRLDPAHDPAVRWRELDIQNAGQVAALLDESQPDTVFHFGTLATGRCERPLVEPTFQSEVIGIVNLLGAATSRPIRRIVVPASLEEPLGGEPPASPYAAAKAASRLYVQLFAARFGVSCVRGRVFMSYGPEQGAGKVIPSIVNAYLRGEAPRLSSPARLVDWVYVADAVDALLRLGATSQHAGETVDIGSGQLVSIGDVARKLHRLCGSTVDPPYLPGSAPESGPRREADVQPARIALGWSATTSLDRGLALTVDSIKATRSRPI